MTYRFKIAVLAVLAFAGCGDAVGSEPPQLTDDLDWVVRIEFSGHHFCTGFILSEHWLLTAAHCAWDASDDQIKVEHEIFEDRKVVYEGGAQLLVHPDYVEVGGVAHRWHDIALVGLREGGLEVGDRARLSGLTRTFAILWNGAHSLYSVGYGRLPDPETGTCGEERGSKKRYDGLDFIELTAPLFLNALGVELDGRADALCDGDSGAPLLFDLDGVPNVFAVFSGDARYRNLFYGTLTGPKLGWIESATAATEAPLDCRDLGDESWACFE
jgi:hypothetical protein